MKYYEVAPLRYIGKDIDVLTYSSPTDIPVGSLVEISLRNKNLVGVIINKATKPSFSTKEINNVLFDKPALSSMMLKLARWMSDYYLASLVSVLNTMIPSGVTKKRRPLLKKDSQGTTEKAKKLTGDQTKVIADIRKSLDTRPQLLFGVTGSGKTEIYLQLISEQLEAGKGVIVLVPEISLTPQAMERYTARFGDRVAILHSQLKETERFATWKDVLEGEKDIIIGSRSALFAPVKNLGLIVIDEAHETSYKQDQTPRYDARLVAEKIAEINGCGLIFGTATPNIDMLHKAKSESLAIHTLNKRIVQENMPGTEIVDMRNEFRYGNKSIFSEKLREEIKITLKSKGQIMLFINRRGMSTFVSCRDCGYVASCPNCDIPLTFHYEDLIMTCHHCGHREAPAVQCPKCNSMAIKYFGSGTQRVEQEIKKLFGDVRISRMDRDTTKKTGSHERLYKEFAQNDVDIMIGTQMITKGWDLPNVQLVGIVSADAMLNYPDYRANERAYQLITQISGRTGRGSHLGKVIIQTYSPENPVFEAIIKNDYDFFYKKELAEREDIGYPPFVKLVKLLYNNESSEKAVTEADRVAKLLNKYKIIGPSPAFIPKLAGKYRWQIVVKLPLKDETSNLQEISKILTNDWSIDVDPVSLL